MLKKFFFRFTGHKRKDGVLLITLDGDQTEETKDAIMRLLETRLSNGKVESISFSDSLTTIHYSFAGLKSATLEGFHASLKEVAPVRKMNVFFNSQGGLF